MVFVDYTTNCSKARSSSLDTKVSVLNQMQQVTHIHAQFYLYSCEFLLDLASFIANFVFQHLTINGNCPSNSVHLLLLQYLYSHLFLFLTSHHKGGYYRLIGIIGGERLRHLSLGTLRTVTLCCDFYKDYNFQYIPLLLNV